MTTIHGTVTADIPHSTTGGYVRLRWVPLEEIPAEHRTLVSLHVDRLARLHGLGRVRVRYFAGATEDGAAAFSWYVPAGGYVLLGNVSRDRPNAIALHHGLRGDELVAHTIAHEIAHLLQQREGWEHREEFPTAFADDYLRAELGVA